MAQITSVTSEALQQQIRNLLPSQQGFGEDLQATNVITPIIDLTAAAEGSSLPLSLASADAFGSNTAVNINNAVNTLIINNTGFWRLSLSAALNNNGTGSCEIKLDDGIGTKVLYRLVGQGGGSIDKINQRIDLTIFLRPGDSVVGTASQPGSELVGSYRQIADVNGVIVNPSGFSPQ